MAGIDEVLERLVVDTDFRAALARDADAALVEYGLTPEEVALLASRVDDRDEAQRLVEQRTSKSALLAALGMLGGEATEGVGADEALTVGGNRTEGPADEYTKVPAPPAPPAPTPLPNTAEADGAIGSLEIASEGIDVDVDVSGDDLAVPDGDAGGDSSGQPGAEESEAAPEPGALVQAAGPEPDDVLEIADVDETGGRGS